MVARVARFEGVNVERAQQTMEEAEAVVRPVVEALPGFAGRLDMATADGKFTSITLFDTAESAAAAEQTFDEELPKQLGALYESWGGSRVAVDVFQVVSDVRA